jgi:hypothetical protein
MDGAWMGFAWSMGAWHRNIVLKTLHVSVGDMFRGSNCFRIKTCAGLPTKTWHVLMGGRFWVSPYLGIKTCGGGPWKLPCFSRQYVLGHAAFGRQNWHQVAIKTWHGLVLVCSRGSCYLCIKTHTRPLQNERHIYDLSLK